MIHDNPHWEPVTLVGPSGTLRGRMWRDNDADSPLIDVDGWSQWQRVWEDRYGYEVKERS